MTAALLALATWLAPAAASAAQKVHVVSSGQRLGSIAKRYNISIEELCQANGIRRNAPIRPGQKLVIPDKAPKSDKAGKEPAPDAAQALPAPTPSVEAAQPKEAPPTTRKAPTEKPRTEKSAARPLAAPKVHVVARGQTLGGIARRYNVSIDALCRASGISRRTTLRLGQKLVVPNVDDETGEIAATYRTTGRLDRVSASRSGRISHKSYARNPARRGYLTLVRYDRTWSGQVVGQRSGKLLPKARATVSALLGASSTGAQMDSRLLLLLVKVSDHFGGRPVRVVSGMRDNSYFHDSKHPLGRAMDFSIPGVPNEAVRDYARTLGNVGVGYYPNSSFVHLDVRDRPTYWVDYAGPGEAPRATPWRVAARPAAPAESAPVAAQPVAAPAEGTLAPTPAAAPAPATSVAANTPAAAPGAAEPTQPTAPSAPDTAPPSSAE